MFPKGGCQLSMVCDLSNPENKGRDNNVGCSAEESDYLRLVGYRGLLDSMYCEKKVRMYKDPRNHQHFKSLSDYLEKCQFTTVLMPIITAPFITTEI